jgi:phosphate:Na+ symporter
MKQKISITVMLVLMLAHLNTSLAYAADDSVTIDWFALILGLFGGLALFLAGLEQLSDGLKKLAGNALKNMLSKLTVNRIMGSITGAFITGILNSSSITTVLAVSFVTAGVMTLQQSVSVIMGANIGSTVTAQLLAFNVSRYALLPVIIGFFMLFTAKQSTIRNLGMMVMGLGLVFFGMSMMGDAMYPLRSFQPFLDMLQKMENPLLGIVAGTVFTGLVQSSAATVGIAIAMAGGGLLSLEAGIALALGANIGTCVTALMAAIGKPVEAVRVAMVHVAFNVIGVLLWLPFISDLAGLAQAVSPGSPGIADAAGLASQVPRQIANANTIFNVLNTCIFLPFTGFFALLAKWMIKDRPEPEKAIQPMFLDDSLLEVTALALDAVRKELGRTAEILLEMMNRFDESFAKNDFNALHKLVNEYDKINILETASTEYLGKIRTGALSEKESMEHQSLMTCAITLGNMAEVIEIDLIDIAEKAKLLDYQRSEKSREMLRNIYRIVRQSVTLLTPILVDKDLDSAQKVMAFKPVILEMQKAFIQRKSERLGSTTPDALKYTRIEVSAADKLQRIYSLCKRVANIHIYGLSLIETK